MSDERIRTYRAQISFLKSHEGEISPLTGEPYPTVAEFEAAVAANEERLKPYRDLEAVLAELRMQGEAMRFWWLLTPHSLLSGRTPWHAILDGDVERVIAAARAYGVS